MADEKFEIRNPEVETILRGLGHEIGRGLPPGQGFCLLIFGYESKELYYIANCDRQSVIKAMREFIAKNAAN